MMRFFFSGSIPDAGPELNEGKIGYIVFGDTISLHLSDVSIEYNSIIDNPGEYYEPFDLEYGSWFYENNSGIAIWREDGKLNLFREANSISSIFLFSPVGPVKDFSFEIGGGGYINEGGGYIFRLYDFQHYTVVMMMDDELSIVYSDGFPGDSVKTLFESPLNINFDETNIKFEMEGEAPNIDVRLWLSDSTVYSGTMTGVSSKMSVGNLGFSLEGDTIIAHYDFVNILYEPMVTSFKEDAKENIISEYKLYQNYPNPFNPVTSIKYQVARREMVVLKIFDVLGNEIATLVNEQKAPGVYSVKFDGSNLSSGVYIYRITAGNYIGSKKLLLLK
ncbi:MAG: T9SS type A sorting domain-containing protein [Melioribacteraceae bacterium]|nr:T9SS type A sorting domain-containing protein [Melioribacteraceae bacterium]MCF8396465.1 T9SS type A sorting domain-containing protein [Melioribacteraceae bacterium]